MENTRKRITLTLSKKSFQLLERYQYMLRVLEEPSTKQEIIVNLVEGLLLEVEGHLPPEEDLLLDVHDVLEVER